MQNKAQQVARFNSFIKFIEQQIALVTSVRNQTVEAQSPITLVDNIFDQLVANINQSDFAADLAAIPSKSRVYSLFTLYALKVCYRADQQTQANIQRFV